MSARALAAAFAASARERARYPGDALGSSVFLGLLLFTFTQLWTTAAHGGRIGAYAPAQLVLYLLVAELVTLAPGAVHVSIGARVRSGDLATDLLRPVDWIAWELARSAGSSVVRMATLLAVGAPALVLLVGMPRLDPRGVAVGLLVLVPLAVLLESCIRVLVGLLAFWFEESTPFYWIWQKLSFTLGGLMLPLDLYPEWLRSVASCLPVASILFAPARAVVAYDARETIVAILTLCAWLAVAWLTLGLAYGRASRRLQLNGG